MRFGIMDMQFDALIPPGLSPENAAAHLAGFDHAAEVRRLAENGFRLIELGGDLVLFFPQVFAAPAIERLAALKTELGLSYTVHLPLWSSELATPLEPVREGSVLATVEMVRATLPLQPEVYVLHATGSLATEFYHQIPLPDVARGLILQHFFQIAARTSVHAILNQTGLDPRRLALETVDYPFDLLLALAEECSTSICLDTGHILAGFSGPVDLETALESALPRLAEIHLHDAPWQGPDHRLRIGEDHQALGKGALDLARLLDRLSQASYRGPVIFELTLPEAQASLARIRTLRPDVVEWPSSPARRPPAPAGKPCEQGTLVPRATGARRKSCRSAFPVVRSSLVCFGRRGRPKQTVKRSSAT